MIEDGIYFLSPEGGAWIAARFRAGRYVDHSYESEALSHDAARDSWQGIVPEDTDIEVTDEETHTAIVRKVMGKDVDPEMVYVARRIDQ